MKIKKPKAAVSRQEHGDTVRLLREIVAILEEGRPETRIARLLISRGWKSSEVHSKLRPLLHYVTFSGMYNSVRDFEVTGTVFNELYADSARFSKEELCRLEQRKFIILK